MTPRDLHAFYRPLLAWGILPLCLIITAGCQLCCPPYMDDYATVGGKWNRMDPTRGRVGSAFSDPGVSHGPITHGTTIYADPSMMPAHDGNGRGELHENGFEQWESSPQESLEWDDVLPSRDLEARRTDRSDDVIILGH